MNPDLTIRLVNETDPVSPRRIDRLIIYEEYQSQPKGSGKIGLNSDKYGCVNPYFGFEELFNI
jgi:hypothetical protein